MQLCLYQVPSSLPPSSMGPAIPLDMLPTLSVSLQGASELCGRPCVEEVLSGNLALEPQIPSTHLL